MSIELVGNIVAKRLNATGLAAAADQDSKQRLVSFMQRISGASQVCATLRRTGLAERAVDLAAAGSRFKVSEVDNALEQAPLLTGRRGDTHDLQSRMAFKVGLQQLGLL